MENKNAPGGFALTDAGPAPFVINIVRAARQNGNFRLALWTGEHLQTTLMSIPVGADIGLERHDSTDQLLFIEQGQAIVRMGETAKALNFERPAAPGYAIFVPAGTWHDVINTGSVPLRLFSVYAPPQHPRGTVHRTKKDAEAAEAGH